MRHIKAGTPSHGSRLGIVQQRREIGLRAIGVIDNFAVRIATLEDKVVLEAALHFHDASVIAGAGEILQQVAASNQIVRGELSLREGQSKIILDSVDMVYIRQITYLRP